MVLTHLDEDASQWLDLNSDLRQKKKENNLELVFIEPKSCGVFDLEILQHTGIMLFVNCPTSSMYVNESIVFGILMELCFSVGGQNHVRPAVLSHRAMDYMLIYE